MVDADHKYYLLESQFSAQVKGNTFFFVTPKHPPTYQLSMDNIFAICSGKRKSIIKKPNTTHNQKTGGKSYRWQIQYSKNKLKRDTEQEKPNVFYLPYFLKFQ